MSCIQGRRDQDGIAISQPTPLAEHAPEETFPVRSANGAGGWKRDIVSRAVSGVSTYGQTLDAQLEQLRAAGCSSRNIYREKVTGARGPARASPHARPAWPRQRSDGDADRPLYATRRALTMTQPDARCRNYRGCRNK